MTPRRRFRTPPSLPRLDPPTFVRRLVTKIGTPYGANLARRAFESLTAGADPQPWMREVREARAARTLSPDVSWFLLYKFAEAAILRTISTDPELDALEARIVAIELAHGLEELDTFPAGEGPPEWEAANAEWERVFDGRIATVLRSIGEEEIAAVVQNAGDDQRFERGRAAIFGPIEE